MEQTKGCVFCGEAGAVVCGRCGEPACHAHGPTPEQAWCRLCQGELDSEIELRTFAVQVRMDRANFLGYQAQGPTVADLSAKAYMLIVLKCTRWTILHRFKGKTPEEIKTQREGTTRPS